LKASRPGGRVVAFEWDEEALALSRSRLAQYGERVSFVHRSFSAIPETLAELGIQQVDGILLDLGLSSLQLDISGKGFSFQRDAELDMRMDRRGEKTAAELLQSASEGELADIFHYLGEERFARRIARMIVEVRRHNKIERTGDLVHIVEQAVPPHARPKKIHVATKVFQAIRIAVNREMENLSAVLEGAPHCLASGARFCVISFHSLEDRLVKRVFRESSCLKALSAKPMTADSEECSRNPRARSAKLRVAAREGGQ
jgi:16S rRNA (cytosine1402-N4)-methyltransferase